MVDVACYVCREVFPRELMQEHHIHPQAAGGRDKETSWLCAGCHHNLHRISEMLVAGKTAKALDVAERSFKEARPKVKRMMELAGICAREMKALKEGDIAGPEFITISVSDMPREDVTRLKLMAFEWNNSKAGLAPFLRNHLRALARGKLDRAAKRVRRPEHSPSDNEDECGVINLA